MGRDLISIVIPVYNVEEYLDDCIKSVLNQSYKNIEVFLINDGSTDNSLSICRKYEVDERITVINQENKGLSKTRQRGIDIINGKYFCMIDSDDFIATDFIQALYNKITEMNADISICSRIDFDENYKRVIPLDEDTLTIELNNNDISNHFSEFSNKFILSDSWNKMYKTEFVRRTNVRFSLDNKYNGTDLLFNHLLILHLPKVTTINIPLYNHRIVKTSRVHRKNKQLQKGFLKVFNRLISEIDQIGLTEQMGEQLAIYFIKLQRLAADDLYKERHSKKNIEKEYDEFIRVFNDYYEDNINIDLRKVNLGIRANFFFKCMRTNSSKKLICYYTIINGLKSLYLPIKHFIFTRRQDFIST